MQKQSGQIIVGRLYSDLTVITWNLFLLVLFLAVFLPDQSLLGLNLRLISSGLFLIAFVVYLFIGGHAFSGASLISMALIVGMLCFWSLLAVWNGAADVGEILLELRQIAAAIGIAFLSIASIRRGLIKAERLIVVIIYGTFAISFVKAALVAASFISNVDPISVTRVLFGDNVRAEPIILGLVRLDFSADIVGAFALFALLAPSVSGVHFGRASKVIISLVVLLGSGFLTYARAIWLVYVVCVVAAMVVERNWKAMVLTVCATVTFVAVSYGVLSTIFEERFITEAELSDEGRVDQAKHLIEEIKVRPVLGKGMGAHFDSDSRGDKQRYSYELQWLAFLMQFGILGVMGIVVLIAASAHDLVKARHPARPWVLLIFALWLLESCLNPHMTSSYAGATFGLFMAMFYRMRNAKNDGMNETMAVFPVTATH